MVGRDPGVERTGWNQTRAATVLGLKSRYRIEKFNLAKSGYADTVLRQWK
jgi:hypothetical protein